MRQLRNTIDITRAFSVFIQEDPSESGGWNAFIVGHELDNVTCGKTPYEALLMASDLISMLTGMCLGMNPHDWSVDTVLSDEIPIPAWGCVNCGELAAKTEFDDFAQKPVDELANARAEIADLENELALAHQIIHETNKWCDE